MRLVKIWSLGLGISLSLSPFSLSAETLKDAIQQTIQSNPDVLINIKTWLASQQTISEARGGYFPKVDLVAEYGREHTNRNISSDGYPESNYSTYLTRQGVGVSLKQILFDGSYTHSEVACTKSRTIADAYKTQGAADDIALMAVKAYLDVLRTRQFVALAQQNFTSHQRIYDMIRQRSKTGLGREADTMQAYGRLALARANLLATESNYHDATTTYEKIIGTTPHQLRQPASPLAVDLPSNEATAVEEALSYHPTLKAAQADIEEAKAQLASSKAANLPKVSAVVTVSNYHNTGGTKGRNNDYIAGLQMNYNLFNGGTDMARQKETAILLAKAEEIEHKTHAEVVESIKLSWNAAETAQKQLSYFDQHQTASKQTVVSYREQFLLGKRTLLDLLDSENELFTSQTDLLNGQYILLFSKYRILNSEGRLLPYLGITVSTPSELNIALPPAFPVTTVKPAKPEPPVMKKKVLMPTLRKTRNISHHSSRLL